MPKLTFIHEGKKTKLDFCGTPLLRDVLVLSGFFVSSHCGGRGGCGKCRVKVSGDVSAPNEKEMKIGFRLACQTRLLGDAEAELIETEKDFVSVESSTKPLNVTSNDIKYGVAVDIGTTTVVLKIYNSLGACIGEASALNPQRFFSADVMGRISEALNGKAEILKKQINDCITSLLVDTCKQINILPNEIDKTVITGNTAMLYLYTGRSPESISHAPFEADTLFGEYFNEIYLPPCMNAFVGADITCAVLSCDMCEGDRVSLLCDIGTNGEIALCKNGNVYVTSAAAGPAFEGAEISCGCGCVSGAIEYVTAKNGTLSAYTTDGKAAIGICGSGLISAVASFLELGLIDKSGYAEHELELSSNGGTVTLTQDDIRALQLAKSAICSAIEILLSRTNTNISDIDTFYLSGGFGNSLDLADAERIGLVPNGLARKTRFIGNGALSGAAELLFDEKAIKKAENIAKSSIYVGLAGEDDFYKAFIKNIDF